jgi:pimeloyl-ACP methyl ester carboxylesterase
VDDVIALIAPWLVDTSDPDNERSYIQFFRMNPRVLLRDYWLCHTFNIEPHLPQIQPPILVVGADRDYVYPFDHNRLIFERAQRAELVCIQGEGHFVPGEKPGKLVAEIATWLSATVALNTLTG